MEPAGEELNRLRAESSSSKQLLTSQNAQLLACKDELLTNRGAESQRCQELLQCSVAMTKSDAAAAGSSKRQLLHDSSALPFDRDEILDQILTYVGGGDHLYVGGVNRWCRGRYIQYCVHNSKSELDGKLMTRHRSVLMTESRLQLALRSGLVVTTWTFDTLQQARPSASIHSSLRK
jgi:hypothetical protein